MVMSYFNYYNSRNFRKFKVYSIPIFCNIIISSSVISSYKLLKALKPKIWYWIYKFQSIQGVTWQLET